MNLKNLSNDSRKKFIIAGIVSTIALIILFPLIYVFEIENCEEPFENCDHFLVHLEKHRYAVFCLNETNSILKSLHLYDCNNVLKFTLFDTFEIFKALKVYFRDERATSLIAQSYKDNTCPYLFHEHLIKFCFDTNRLLSHVILFDKLSLNPQEAHHLNIYLKVFFK